MRCLDSIVDSMDMNLSILWDIVNDREAWQGAVHGVSRSWTPRSDSTTINIYPLPAEEPLGSLRSEAARQGDNVLFYFSKSQEELGKERLREGRSWVFLLLSHCLYSSVLSVFNSSIVFVLQEE